MSDGALLSALKVADAHPVRRRWEEFQAAWVQLSACSTAICLHDTRYPPNLRNLDYGPTVIYVHESPKRRTAITTDGPSARCVCAQGSACGLTAALRDPAVAICGPRDATSYGVEVAHSLARDLALAGVTLIAGLGEGAAGAALMGALDAVRLSDRAAPPVTVMPCGVTQCHPASYRELHRRLCDCGPVVSEHLPRFPVRRWAYPARERMIAGMAALTILVEGSAHGSTMIGPTLALEAGREVGAIPGPLTSPASAGPHALMADGAHVIRGAQDVLDILYGVGVRRAPHTIPALEPQLRRTLQMVHGGFDTVSKLADTGIVQADVVAMLAELEVRGRVRRIDASRYRVTPDAAAQLAVSPERGR